MAITANGSRICDTDRVALVAIDVNLTLSNNIDFIIFAGGVLSGSGNELKGGRDHSWQFREVGGVFAEITTSSVVRLADTVSLIHNTSITEAERRANPGGAYIDIGREFETSNIGAQRGTAKDLENGESQIGLDFSGAVAGTQYEFQCTWTEKNEGGIPVIYSALITAAGAAVGSYILSRHPMKVLMGW